VKGEVIWENYTTAGHILQLTDRLIVRVFRAGMQPPKGDYDYPSLSHFSECALDRSRPRGSLGAL
jgi:hypothetical protein